MISRSGKGICRALVPRQLPKSDGPMGRHKSSCATLTGMPSNYSHRPRRNPPLTNNGSGVCARSSPVVGAGPQSIVATALRTDGELVTLHGRSGKHDVLHLAQARGERGAMLVWVGGGFFIFRFLIPDWEFNDDGSLLEDFGFGGNNVVAVPGKADDFLLEHFFHSFKHQFLDLRLYFLVRGFVRFFEEICAVFSHKNN